MIISVARSSPRHTRESTRSLGLARRGQLIILDVVRIASWILGTSVPLKKGPSARGPQTVPHSKTGTRAQGVTKEVGALRGAKGLPRGTGDLA